MVTGQLPFDAETPLTVAAIPAMPTPSSADQARALAEPILAAIANDPGFDEWYECGWFMLGICNQDDTPLEARWDNLRIWDILDLSLP